MGGGAPCHGGQVPVGTLGRCHLAQVLEEVSGAAAAGTKRSGLVWEEMGLGYGDGGHGEVLRGCCKNGLGLSWRP